MKDLPTGQARWQEVGERPERTAGWMGPDRRECLRGRGGQGGTEPRRPFTHSGAACQGPRALTQPPQGGRPPA